MSGISSEKLLKNPDLIKHSYKVRPHALIQYTEDVKNPYKEQLRNLDASLKYSINYLGSGVDMKGKDIALGSNYFIESGKCDDETSSDNCKGKTKYTYVRNIPTGTIPPFNLSFYNATGCNLTGLTEGRGLVPGLFEQVYDINPVELGRAISGIGNLGSNSCKEMSLPIGYKIYDSKREDETWKWETKCTAGHHTMTETSDKDLNKAVRNQNPTIPNARLPGPLQLRENFEQTTESSHNKYSIILLLGCITALVFLRSAKLR